MALAVVLPHAVLAQAQAISLSCQYEWQIGIDGVPRRTASTFSARLMLSPGGAATLQSSVVSCPLLVGTFDDIRVITTCSTENPPGQVRMWRVELDRITGAIENMYVSNGVQQPTNTGHCAVVQPLF